jgi:hypothetical protein
MTKQPIRSDVDSRLVVFPDENHWVNKPENRCVRNRVAKAALSSPYPSDPYASLSRTHRRFFVSLKWHYELFRWFAKYAGTD